MAVYADPSQIVAALQAGALFVAAGSGDGSGLLDAGSGPQRLALVVDDQREGVDGEPALVILSAHWELSFDPGAFALRSRRVAQLLTAGGVISTPGEEYRWAVDTEKGRRHLGVDEDGFATLLDP